MTIQAINPAKSVHSTAALLTFTQNTHLYVASSEEFEMGARNAC